MADLERPLLQQGNFFEDCPGCKLERRKLQQEGAPKKELFYVAMLNISNALPISSIFPFLYFMVEDFNIAKTDKDIGYYAGYIGAAFMFGRFLTSAFWGMAADKYGRKPTFIIGMTSIFLFNTLFGFSTNFWMAVSSRIFLGIFNGMFGPIRAYISEICKEEHQSLGLSLVGTSWGVGLVIGPAIGGFLSQPSTKYPTLFPNGSLFDRFAYALPCLCISMFAVFSLAMVFWLPESLHNHPREFNLLREDEADKGQDDKVYQENSCETETSEGDHVSGLQEAKKTSKEKPTSKKWDFVAAVFVYCLWGVHDMAYSEIFSLWAVSPLKYGGLGLTTSDVGIVLAISGAALLVFQVFLFRPLDKVLGPILMARIPAVLTLPLVAIFPLIPKLQGSMLWIALNSASIIKNILSICTVTGQFVMINNSVTSDQRGAANGISLSIFSFFKALSPACAGALFSWSQKHLDASFLPGTWMVFFVLNIFCFITVIFTFHPILPRSLNKPKLEVHMQTNDQDETLNSNS